LEEVTKNNTKANLFLNTFFPKMGKVDRENTIRPLKEIAWEPITKQEIYKLLKAAKGTTAPGEDGIPTLV
jgi:hypothetical protein